MGFWCSSTAFVFFSFQMTSLLQYAEMVIVCFPLV